jgi:hypothetical protein
MVAFDVNTASKINAGLDIITLCSVPVTAPIFVDNKESVTNIMQTESQKYVSSSPDDKVLRIN